MSYTLILSKKAEKDLDFWNRSGQRQLVEKIYALFAEIMEHPYTGTGQLERLRGNLSGHWSRRIDKQHRLVYTIEDEVVTVTVVSMYGHYGEK